MNIFLGLIILIWAIALGATSTYFSVTGLALTIYSGALLPVIIMGAGVEGSKFLIVAWLHTYWHKLSWGLKLPSLLFVACIMVLTSSGVFAFLSKAHNSSAEPTESFELKIEQIENQITLYKKDLDRYQKQLDQLDKNIDKQIDSGKTTRDQILVQQQRDKQKNERDQIYGLIEKTNQKINELQNQKFDNKQNVVNLDLKLAPVKAIASVIGVDANEHAVNFVNAWFVLVFDPVAIFMVIMAQYCFTFRTREKNKSNITIPSEIIKNKDISEPINNSISNIQTFLEEDLNTKEISDYQNSQSSSLNIISSESDNKIDSNANIVPAEKIKKDRKRSNRKRNQKNITDNIENNINNSLSKKEMGFLAEEPQATNESITEIKPTEHETTSQIINTNSPEQINVSKQHNRIKKKDNQEIVEKLKKDQELLKELMEIVSQAVPDKDVQQTTNVVDKNWLDKRMFNPKDSGV